MVKRYWLALGWWAARWFAHIGVLKYIEDNDIQIREVSWTSMWAIIGALYVIWKTSEQIRKISHEIKILKLIDIDFRTGLLKWNKVEKKLYELFWDRKIEDHEIKLKIVATNLEEGKKVIFDKGRIVDAVRASLSLPWIFSPKDIEWVHYVDWWITCNLPIDVLRSKYCIWVTALKKVDWPLVHKKKVFWFNFKKWFFDLNYQILHRTILIMMKQNEDKSIEKKENLVLISPDFWDLDYYSFNKIDEIIEVWYKESEKQLKNIK